MSDLDRAGMQIDINGNGVMDVFNPYLKVTHVHSEIRLPNVNSQYREASFDFQVDPSIKNPFFIVKDDKIGWWYYSYFTQISEFIWRVTLVGMGQVTGHYWYPIWKEPLMHSNMILLIGGNRG